jgi:hypothetical protein
MSEELFPYELVYDPRENFNYHVIEFILGAGKQGGIRAKVECKGADKKDCVCTSERCEMKNLISMCGWEDVMKAAGDIPLGKVSARMDLTDNEEPWVEVEP